MINQLFILGTIVLIIMIINISLHSTIKTLNGNVLAIGIAIIEIAVAAAVWLKYRGDQKKRKTYQIKGLLKTLCVIHSIVFRLYDYKFINTDSTKYEEKKLMLEKKYFNHGKSSTCIRRFAYNDRATRSNITR